LLSGTYRHIQQYCEAAKNHACAWKFLLPLHSVSPPFRRYLPREEIKSDSFWAELYCFRFSWVGLGFHSWLCSSLHKCCKWIIQLIF
jgi:hypothetical protein